MKRSSFAFFGLVIVLLISVVFSSGCSGRQTLLFLNWGEYINDDLIDVFEEKYNCNVIVDIADSNELFYSKIKSGTTAYDLVCPAEYMVEKMYLAGLLQKIDYEKLGLRAYGLGKEDPGIDVFMDGVVQIRNQVNEDMKLIAANYNHEYDYDNNEISHYYMPYYWGTFGLMYNKTLDYFKDEATYDVDGVFVSNEPDGEPDILQKDNQAWKVYFNDSTLSAAEKQPSNLRVGAYKDSVRFWYGAVATYLYGSPNYTGENNPINITQDVYDGFKKASSQVKYKEWGGDSLKHGIISHNLDFAFAYTGDCLDMIYVEMGDNGVPYEEVEFNTYTPAVTMAHIDSLVIPHNARHVDLAHEFMKFLLTPEYSWYNNRDIGYCNPLKEVYDMIVTRSHPDYELFPELEIEDDDDEKFWLENWAQCISATFPTDDGTGSGKSIKSGLPFSFFEQDDIKKLTNIVNNIKAGY